MATTETVVLRICYDTDFFTAEHISDYIYQWEGIFEVEEVDSSKTEKVLQWEGPEEERSPWI